jgi:hypothetical protein
MADGPVAIPGMIAEFLEARSTVGVACTRDRELRPRVHFLSGWAVAEGGRELECLVGRGFAEGLPEALRECPLLSVTIEQIGPHETYQFKGAVVGSRPPGPDDRALWERTRARFSEAVRRVDPRLGLTDGHLRDYIPPPELALRLSVREIFLQTPGPGAGRRLAPPPEDR